MYRLYKFYFVLLLLMFNYIGISQCGVTDTLVIIPGDETINFQLLVDGIANNDLSDPNQGVCEVTLKFEHTHVNELTIELVSPAGQRIFLVGKYNPLLQEIWGGNKWDISFEPCSSTVSPDLNFDEHFNTDNKWYLGDEFTGVYYPNSGCLEEFNTGPVNGTWSFIIRDYDKIYKGKFLGFSIEFCDGTSIDCDLCDANAGYFQGPNYTFCIDDPNKIIDTNPNYRNSIPDHSKYNYKYLLYKNGNFIQLSDNLKPDLSSVGKYEICGLSYFKNDSLALFNWLQEIGGTSFKDSLKNKQSPYCANISDTCITINVMPLGTVIGIDTTICYGDTLTINNQKFSETGDYYVSSLSPDCSVAYDIHLDVIELHADISASNTVIQCPDGYVELTGLGYTPNVGMNFKWLSDVQNEFEDSPTIIVSKAGKYYFIISTDLCSDTSSVTITSDTDVPIIEFELDRIDCNKDSAKLTIISTNSVLGNVKWVNENGDIFQGQEIYVKTGGKYSILATNNVGCSVRDYINVVVDTIKPTATITATAITCDSTYSKINISSNIDLKDIYWIEFNSHNSNQLSLTPGIFHVEYKGENGCVAFDSIEVVSEKRPIDFSIISDTLNCEISQSTINLTTSLTSAEYRWITPTNDTIQNEDIVVTEPGIYEFWIHNNENGCDTMGVHEVILDNIPPPISFTKDTFLLTCANDSIDISATIGSFNSIRWNGPGGFQSSQTVPRVFLEGYYYVHIQGENSCFREDSVFVKADVDIPQVEIRTDTINCLDDEANLSVKYFGNYSFEWKDPTGAISKQNAIVSRFGGFFHLKVTDIDNGCDGHYSTFVIKDLYQPNIAIVPSDSLNCSNNNITLSLNDYTSLDEILWTGANLTSSEESIKVTESGRYNVSVTASSLCTADTFIDIVSTNIFLNPDTFRINCIDTVVELVLKDVKSSYDFKWTSQNFTSVEVSPKVDRGGIYKVIVSNGNCVDSTEIVVIENKESPNFTIQYDSLIICNPDFSILKANIFSTNVDSFSWTNNSGFYSQNLIDTVRNDGIYQFYIRNNYGCEVIEEFKIKKSQDYAEVSTIGDTINCKSEDQQLTIDAKIEGDYTQVLWEGNNFSSKILKNNVENEGRYYITVFTDKGCITRDSVDVIIDTLKPSLVYNSLDLITCFNDSISVGLLTDAKNPKFLTYGPYNFISNKQNFYVHKGGDYYINIEADNGCVKEDTIKVDFNLLKPYVIIDAEDLDYCDSKKTIVVSSSANTFNTTWYLPEGDSVIIKDLVVSEAGVYKVKIQDLENGCFNVDSVKINWDTTQVKIHNAHDYYLPCDGSMIEMIAFSDSPSDTILWFGPDLGNGQGKYTSEGTIAHTNLEGKYTIIAVGKNCSTNNEVIHVYNKKINPEFYALGGSINCFLDSVPIKAIGVKDDKLFEWTGPNNFYSNIAEPYVSVPGEYSLRVVGQNACDSVATVIVDSDTISPEVKIVFLDSLICEKQTGRLNTEIINKKDVLYSYIWSTNDGTISQGIYDRNPIIKGQGKYFLTTTNTENGCKTKDSLNVESNSYSLDSVIFTIYPPTCYGFADGAIDIDSVIGGTPPYSYSLDNYWFSNNISYNSKSAGNYHFYIKDKYGCRKDTNIIVSDGSQLQLKLGVNKENIYLGDSVTVKAIILASNAIDSFQWEPEYLFNNQNDSIQIITLPISTNISLNIIDENGCEANDIIWVDVISKPNVYVANIFTPNSDGINDYFYIKSGVGVRSIKKMMIFDNWGEKLFEKRDLRQNVSIDGWDGKFKGEFVSSGVYVYRIILELENGSIEEIIGDVTVIR